jgi:hypothetical protein
METLPHGPTGFAYRYASKSKPFFLPIFPEFTLQGTPFQGTWSCAESYAEVNRAVKLAHIVFLFSLPSCLQILQKLKSNRPANFHLVCPACLRKKNERY